MLVSPSPWMHKSPRSRLITSLKGILKSAIFSDWLDALVHENWRKWSSQRIPLLVSLLSGASSWATDAVSQVTVHIMHFTENHPFVSARMATPTDNSSVWEIMVMLDKGFLERPEAAGRGAVSTSFCRDDTNGLALKFKFLRSIWGNDQVPKGSF